MLFIGCNQKGIQYPETKKVDSVDNYFGMQVSDPYRWLEDDNSEETKQWVKAENLVTSQYLQKIPFREKIKNRLTEVYNFERMTPPEKIGDRYFYSKNTGLQNQSVYYMQNDLQGESKVILDPNTLSDNGTAAVSIFEVSKDGKYLAYGISIGGSDWVEMYVKNVETNEMLGDHLKWIKFSGAAWYKDGFYYSRYKTPIEGKELTKVNDYQMVYYHKIGTPQSEDQLIYQNTADPSFMYSALVLDKRYLIIYESDWTSSGNGILIKDLLNKNSDFIRITNGFESNFSAIDVLNEKLLILTNEKAPRYQLRSYGLKNISPSNYTILIPEKNGVLEWASLAGNKLMAGYMVDVHSVVDILDYDGTKINELPLPGNGSVSQIHGDKDDTLVFYSYNSYIQPATIYSYNIKTASINTLFTPNVDLDPLQYVSEIKFYQGKDGTNIPISIVHKKDIVLDGANPCLLYGYGGFNVTYMPAFQPDLIVWLENGGVYANAHIRGGGEYGEEWHKAGMLQNKQTVFDDFIQAAEYLIDQKYTSSNKLVIRGGSNGGLLIGAVINQRPDLFKVALPAVGVMDMLRFHNFTIGGAWVPEYGSSNDSVQFNNLIKYSPLHNISDKSNYPAILVTTADHDDRVVPAHSFKYIATLQEKYKGPNPILIRIETNAGHSAGKPTSKRIEEATDMWSFTFFNLGLKNLYASKKN